MALTIATGFVVDDAIVVLENILRYRDTGMPALQATLHGAREVGFTVLSISLSLIAVFLPILLMGGIPGRLFREFSITLSISVLVSLVIALTAVPMICAFILHSRFGRERHGGRIFNWVLQRYEASLGWALRHNGWVLLGFVGTIALNVVLFSTIPKGLFPQMDTGLLYGQVQGDQSISFQAMSEKLQQMMDIIQQDPAVSNVVGFTGAGAIFGGSSNTGAVFVALKPLSQRDVTADQVLARLRPKFTQVPGGRLFLVSQQGLSVGARQSNSQYQYTLLTDNTDDLFYWVTKVVQALEHSSVLTDVTSDQQPRGLETDLAIDRDTAARLGITPAQIDNTLYDALGQRQVSVIYSANNQYHVVMEIDPRYAQFPTSLKDIYVATSGAVRPAPQYQTRPLATLRRPRVRKCPPAHQQMHRRRRMLTTIRCVMRPPMRWLPQAKAIRSSGAAVSTAKETMIPLAAVTQFSAGNAPLAVNHQGLFAASTIAFNLREGATLSQAAAEIDSAVTQLHLPVSIHGSLAGTAQLFQQSLAKEPILIAAAIAAVYILLGVLYESYVHPITILSTLPPAGVGALLALTLFRIQFDIIALIGIVLLIGIVKKNAIMMIDFAIEAKRARNSRSEDAIFEACLLRFRPIIMTSIAAILGAVPLATSFGSGSEIRRPLGIAIIGGLLVSQFLTLYTTPVLYLYMDRFGQWCSEFRRRMLPA